MEMPERKTDKHAPEPWHVPVALEDVPVETGQHFVISADADVRSAIAAVAGLRALPRLDASFEVTRQGEDGRMWSAGFPRPSAKTAWSRSNRLLTMSRRISTCSSRRLRRRSSISPSMTTIRKASRQGTPQFGRTGTAGRRCSRSRRAGNRVPDSWGRPLSPQAGRSFRAATGG